MKNYIIVVLMFVCVPCYLQSKKLNNSRCYVELQDETRVKTERCKQDKAFDEQIMSVMKGLSNEKNQKMQLYLTAGDQTYIIGTQDGDFPDIGRSISGEMGGVWNQTIKLLDGFWLRVADTKKGETCWLENANKFTVYPFGSDFVYESVLDSIQIRRFQSCPDGKNGVYITYLLTNNSNTTQELAIDFVVKTDLSPIWLSDQNGITDAADSILWNAQASVCTAYDQGNNWHCVWGTDYQTTTHTINEPAYRETKGLGRTASTTHPLSLAPGESKEIQFVISGSSKNQADAFATYREIITQAPQLVERKKEQYINLLKRAQIRIPDKKLEEAYNWAKVNTAWMVAHPQGFDRFLIGAALEYPWLYGSDSFYALQGIAPSGDFQLAESTLRTIKDISEKVNGNGRVIHEMSLNGLVGNRGNTQETALFIIAAWRVAQWTGSKELIDDLYPYMQKAIHWLLVDQDTNGNMFPEGFGIMEIRGLNAELIDVAVYTQQALEAMTTMAAIKGEMELSKMYAQQAITLKEKINTLFWDDESQMYCDFYGTKQQALQTVKDALVQQQLGGVYFEQTQLLQDKIAYYEKLTQQISTYPDDMKKGWLTNKNWIISVPMEMKIAPTEKALPQLDKVRAAHCGEFGPYLSAADNKQMMLLSTAVQAVAECKYDRIDEALWYMNCIVKTFGQVMPGSVSEVLPEGGCPVICWTIYAMAVPIINHIFGITPNAFEKSIEINPHLPSGWNEIEISSLRIGNNEIGCKIQKDEKGLTILIETSEPGWTFSVKSQSVPINICKINGSLCPLMK